MFGKKLKNKTNGQTSRSSSSASPHTVKSLIETEFDPDFYLSQYPDVRDKGLDPLEHYISVGWSEGRDPSPDFSNKLYLKYYPDVREAGMDPFFHYLKFGRPAGRTRSPSELGPAASPGFDPDEVKATIREHFDEEYYLETNRDVREKDIDALDHFVLYGWKERRDPNPAFSTNYYLETNLDVELKGINPFYHYLTAGKTEGRPPQPPVTAMPQEAEATREDLSRQPRTAVLSMVKNEWDIIEVFTSQVLALFDVVVFVDHGSEDGTFEFLKEVEASRRDVTVYQLAEPGYLQALTMNHLVQSAKELQDVDWVFLLDADEFLPFADKLAFATELSRLSDCSIVKMAWKNLIPEQYWENKVSWDRDCYVPSQASVHCKVAFQPKKLNGKPFWVEQGNHSVTRWAGGPEIEAKRAFNLWHLPVRSVDQLSLKLSQGVASYLRAGQSRKGVQGQHWFQILSSVKDEDITDAKLNKIVHGYGHPDAEFSPLATEELENFGYDKREIPMAQAKLQVSAKEVGNISELIFKVNGDLAAKEVSDISGRPITRLALTEDQVIRRAQDDSGYEYPALPMEEPWKEVLDDPKQSDTAFLLEVLRPSYWEIEHLTPSAWSGHVPFMYSLIGLLRPRVFAELGTHYGASFFACCRTLKRLGQEARCVAVDTWEGDPQAGFYDNRVFQQFSWILREYDEFGRYLRMTFDEARAHFEDGSIDLLHIDGLHTYEAVRHDFETWLPKLSSRGVIMFHDINVHERDFGVWQLWSEVKARYPTMEFQHSHGLGLACVGDLEGSKFARLLRLMTESQETRFLLQQHFERIAEKSVAIFTNNHRVRQLEQKSGEVGKLNEELSKARQKASALEAERDQFRALVQKSKGD